jgi:thiamine transport system ATP-binding protein
MLIANDLVFAYPGQPVPYRFSLEAEAGQVTAISGASGSGKSTLLDLLSGFLTPQSGSLTVYEEPLLHLPPETRPISLLLQADNLFDHLSAAENAVLGIPKGRDKAERALLVAQALAEVGLDGMDEQITSTLSGGQKQRVALARTLLRARPVLLLDEPFSALDDVTRGAVRELVASLTKRHGWHTVLVSHHSDDIAALASRHYQIVEKQLERI